MKVKTAKCWMLALALAGMGFGGAVTRADVITFTGVPTGILFVGPFTEGAFTYNSLSGNLVSSNNGNPQPDMGAALVALGDFSNVLRIVRNGGGLFTFDGAEVAQV